MLGFCAGLFNAILDHMIYGIITYDCWTVGLFENIPSMSCQCFKSIAVTQFFMFFCMLSMAGPGSSSSRFIDLQRQLLQVTTGERKVWGGNW